MAVVRFSDELKESIIGNAKAVFQRRIDTQRAEKPAIGEEVINMVYAPVISTLAGVNKNFFIWRNDIEIKKIGGKHYGVRYSTNDKYPVPHDKVTLPNGCIIDGSYVLEVTLPDTPEFASFKEQLDTWNASIDDFVQQRDEFVDGVKKIINAHSTLAPALKAWPPLWDLVPETYRERHRKVVERVKPDTPTIDVDLTKLTSTVVASKILK